MIFNFTYATAERIKELKQKIKQFKKTARAELISGN